MREEKRAFDLGDQTTMTSQQVAILERFGLNWDGLEGQQLVLHKA